ncbi:MAG: mycothiol synthase [Acidimicrobiia bacterium]|nr:mycothiol synthase [Acidimicrobiia bacterium]
MGHYGVGGSLGYTMVQLRPESRNEMLALIEEVRVVDETPPLSEYKAMRLEGRLDARERVALDAKGSVVGYGQAAWHRGSGEFTGHWALEVTMAPGHRNPQVTGELITSLSQDVAGTALVLWSRSEYVSEAAETLGWKRGRTLWEMRRPLPVLDLDTSLPDVQLTSFRMGMDEAAWLEKNNAAFAGHPENGDMTRRDLEKRMAQPWFDPDGFLLAWDGDVLVGSCWTKMHEDGSGEIYIIGVIPSWEGRGLGRALVAVGLDYLSATRHARKAMLYVESSNVRALELYDRLGFERTRAIQAFAPPLGPSVEG